MRLAGKVKATILSTTGKEAVVGILWADEFWGEECLIGQPRRLTPATAMTECTATQVEKAENVAPQFAIMLAYPRDKLRSGQVEVHDISAFAINIVIRRAKLDAD